MNHTWTTPLNVSVAGTMTISIPARPDSALPVYVTILVMWSIGSVGIVRAQSERLCETAEYRTFDYMRGDWYGVQYAYEEGDTTFVGTTELSVRNVLDGCANRELMDVHMTNGEHLFNGVGFRSYDSSSRRWLFTEVDDRESHSQFRGRLEDGVWYFLMDRTRNGRDYILRLSYPSVDENHFKQIFERSFDDGRTWRQSSHIEFIRDKPDLD